MTHSIHSVYLLVNDNRTYIGYTNNPIRRLRQHRKEIVGGAKTTTGHKYPENWDMVLLLSGFPNAKSALQFEWRFKHPTGKRKVPRKYYTLEGRLDGLWEILINGGNITKRSKYLIEELQLDLIIQSDKLKNHYFVPLPWIDLVQK